jgi:hypothetical protein
MLSCRPPSSIIGPAANKFLRLTLTLEYEQASDDPIEKRAIVTHK